MKSGSALSTLAQSEEEEQIRQAKMDAQAFRPLYEKYYKPIFLFLLRRTGDKTLTADLAAQVFLRALIGIGKYEFRGVPFSSWLYRIANNECNSFFRRSRRIPVVVIEDIHATKICEEIMADDWAEDVREALPAVFRKLRPRELQLIQLRFLDARAFREVAEILNISESHARVQTYRVLEKMRKLLFGK